ncbi:putative potassium transport system protein kup [Bombilactobacillus mellis]|uniref:Probable potassium transport system protein Kup n=1 Tax=Bombilactobacillus mellis TaxID=1218508 RepID=A0A0F4KZE6_9LACO|nr:KUP/HAK/KT family potassium transporter [Bombilactobacillus mellis]MBI0106734.1 KUP/HAK/KT family potassium transporter [Lactobacillus sp. W8086]MBI0108198.1 KUP/HAK/KT family potassium transporter [Lactobacillus sp. W8085]MBI0111416.1 KUP/HAK/KT family potassium transporter [Lactobacillus sp. W8088]MBI0115131.1 KUP/HAK/KT family potassium transporter [Lactobacillus sp. W8087]MBI0118856.1 KUP/HAK/KT family potassium transporter [Lactobacillus sp. W8089]MBI0130821.1 KUP/HAK/KT family potass
MKLQNSLNAPKSSHNKMTLAGILVALGVVYGDIGTSPMYTMSSLVAGNGGLQNISTDFILGSISLIFWTLTIITTTKYVLIALRADNNGEGGIFALYTLVRKKAKWLLIPAMIGGATFLSDGMMTPAVTVTTAIEGLKGLNINNHVLITNQQTVVLVTIIILSCLFFIQRFGTEALGKAFGPIMLLWFTSLAVAGLYRLAGDWSFLRALNPYYAFQTLISPANKNGIFILGSIFLATTGAEALYSDMGHVGRNNIYGSWPYVKICLLINYLGQGVWLNQVKDLVSYQNMDTLNPFFEMVPAPFRLAMTIIATLAAIIASQALISGSYTLVSEATKLKLLPRLRMIYPTNFKGQLYIPAVNNIIWVLCIAIVIYFQNSERMAGAYGLVITITMLMTTILLNAWLLTTKHNRFLSELIIVFFLIIETIFLISNSVKFFEGGYVTFTIACILIMIMIIWQYGELLKNDNTFHREYVSLLAYKRQLKKLSEDDTLPLYTTNLVYLTKIHEGYKVKKDILYSILDKRPKRAKVYWFVTVNVTDNPYTTEYSVDTFGTDYMVNVQLYLGFRMEQKVNFFLRQIVNEMMIKGELPRQPQTYTTIPDRNVGDFSFVLIQEELSPDTQLNNIKKSIIQARLWLQRYTVTPAIWFGLSYSDVVMERVPLILGQLRSDRLRLIKRDPIIKYYDDGDDDE